MKIHLLFLLLTTYILLFLNFSFSIDSDCSCPEPNYTPGSTFASNLQHLLSDLPRNASQNNYSYNATYGKAPDQVYGLAMCYADARLSACNDCLVRASTAIINCCGFTKQGLAWYDACLMRYSDVAFNASNNMGLEGSAPKGDENNIVRINLADPEKFRGTLRQLMKNLATNASKSALRVAAGTTNYTSNGNIYTLVQCTRQIPPDECRSCIGNLTVFGMEIIEGESSIIRDETLFAFSCYVRYAFDLFYVISEVNAPWPNTGKQSREPMIPIHIFTIITGALWILW